MNILKLKKKATMKKEEKKFLGNTDKQIKDIGKEKKNINFILRGVIFSIILSCILLIIFAAILTYTDISEEYINIVSIIISSVSICIGGIIASIKIRKNGLLNGALVGGIYMGILYLLSSIITSNYQLNIEGIILVIVGIVLGIFGGVIGVNIK